VYCLEPSTGVNASVDLHSSNKDSKKHFLGKNNGVDISQARPEDITPENYPDIIDGFVFSNASLKDVINTISKDLQVKIIMDAALESKKVNIISYGPITVAEAYQAFLSALSIHGLTLIRSGSFLKVLQIDNALKTNTKVYKNKSVKTDQFITSIIKLNHIDATSLEARIKPLIDSKSVLSIIFYPPSDTVIITDYGANVERIKKIIQHLDIPKKDFLFKVIPVKHARAKSLVATINRLKGSYYFGGGRIQKKAPNHIFDVSFDERTNSIIVLSNEKNIKKVESVINQLDYYNPSKLGGGIYVYKVKHGTAEDLEKTLTKLFNGTSNTKDKSVGASPTVRSSTSKYPSNRSRVNFSPTEINEIGTAQSYKDINVIAETQTNSLLIVANEQNYQTVLDILKTVDISRNQVFVKAIIMELNTDKSRDWQIANYFFPKDGQGIARIGYGLSGLGDVTATTSGATLFFPLSLFLGKTLGIPADSKTDVGGLLNNVTGGAVRKLEIPTLSSFVKFLQTNVGANILSTPQVMALDHQEATVEIIEEIPKVSERAASANVVNQFATSIGKEEVKTLLKITPHINPNVDSVRLKVEQQIDDLAPSTSVPEALRSTNVAVKRRKIETNITLKDKETAVLGGLVKETNTVSDSKIPFLGDIPIIGWLFKNSEMQKQKSNLVVFITPHIIRSNEEHKEILSSKLKERMNFIRKFTGGKDPYSEVTEQMIKEQRYYNPEPVMENIDPSTNMDDLKDQNSFNHSEPILSRDASKDASKDVEDTEDADGANSEGGENAEDTTGVYSTDGLDSGESGIESDPATEEGSF